jgi:hypothetical protein
MGLDMYLNGEKFLWTNWEKPEENRTEDGFKITTLELRLGYWRKHPNLHGYIVQNFAKGEDNCEPIELTIEQCEQIVLAIKAKELPKTDGFFFGKSQPEDDPESIALFEKAIAWEKDKKEGESRSIIYKASW